MIATVDQIHECCKHCKDGHAPHTKGCPETTLKEHLTRIGKIGGKATFKKHGKKHFQKMAQLSNKKQKALDKKGKGVVEQAKVDNSD